MTLCLYVRPSVCLLVCLLVCLPACLSPYPCLPLYVCVSVSVSVCVSLNLCLPVPVLASVSLKNSLSLPPSLYLSLSQPLSLYLFGAFLGSREVSMNQNVSAPTRVRNPPVSQSFLLLCFAVSLSVCGSGSLTQALPHAHKARISIA